MKLKLHTKPDVPLEAESITPSVINKLKIKEIEKVKIFHGNREENIADFFSVSKSKTEALEVEGDMNRIKYLGANMHDGEMYIEGNAGAHLGSAMSGGFIRVNGNTGDWIAPEMSGEEFIFPEILDIVLQVHIEEPLKVSQVARSLLKVMLKMN